MAARSAAVLLALAALAGASSGCGRGAPVRHSLRGEPGELAARARDAAAERAPARVRFRWDYADERGPLRGEGVARFNPPDSLRLDLFGAGESSMSAALVGDRLQTVGSVENLQLPPPAFLFATAGIFRPPEGRPAEAYAAGGLEVLAYRLPAGRERRYYLRGSRIERVVEAEDGRVVRRLEVRWSEGEGGWPSGAEYEDRERRRRARWGLEEVRRLGSPFPPEIFILSDDG